METVQTDKSKCQEKTQNPRPPNTGLTLSRWGATRQTDRTQGTVSNARTFGHSRMNLFFPDDSESKSYDKYRSNSDSSSSSSDDSSSSDEVSIPFFSNIVPSTEDIIMKDYNEDQIDFAKMLQQLARQLSTVRNKLKKSRKKSKRRRRR